MFRISQESFNILNEIIEHESFSNYWEQRFSKLNAKEDIILRGIFKELSDNKMISVQWADNYPYIIKVLKDGYLYDRHLKEEKRIVMSQFERELDDILERAKNIKKPINAGAIGTDISEYNRPSDDWINDVEIFYNKYLKQHALANRIHSLLFHRSMDCFSQLVSCLKSIANDRDFIDMQNGIEKKTVPAYQAKTLPDYDVFLSHANADKQSLVDELNSSLEKLGVKIFYDKKSLEWGDKWKDRLMDGTRKAEFAIIVISENFFDREWTEKELNEFLNRQNRNGQKLILPIVHNITNDDLREKYPAVADIQAIDSKNYSCDEIALLFARQLIKRLKAES
ncbi:MAG: toll/interleukin-1 receptor domain-containing protein [Lachnospiraceae bacterium]|nr:toll/interleukin-1 receptor domain-containing protein [Lachnospiraceae bacterium]